MNIATELKGSQNLYRKNKENWLEIMDMTWKWQKKTNVMNLSQISLLGSRNISLFLLFNGI